ncbi:MAG: hypothetical protein ACE147_19675 [Candidatus Methylomirabilales bacterium]
MTQVDKAIADRVRAVLGPLRVVYGAMVGSILVYWIVVQLIRKVGQIPKGRDIFTAVDWLRYPLFALGLAACVAVFLLRRWLFDPAGVVRRAAGHALPDVLSALSSHQILVFAVAEVPVVFGLALYFVGGYLLDFYLLAALSLLAFSLAFPSSREWEDALVALRASRPDLFAAP